MLWYHSHLAQLWAESNQSSCLHPMLLLPSVYFHRKTIRCNCHLKLLGEFVVQPGPASRNDSDSLTVRWAYHPVPIPGPGRPVRCGVVCIGTVGKPGGGMLYIRISISPSGSRHLWIVNGGVPALGSFWASSRSSVPGKYPWKKCKRTQLCYTIDMIALGPDVSLITL